jgi:hypothetical protein
MRVCRLERWRSHWGETKAKIATLSGGKPALVDSTGVGDPILEDLQRTGTGWFEGFQFSSGSKQQLMEGLAGVIQQRQVRFPEGPIKNELDAFEYETTGRGVRYSAPDGEHDDCVCALALAVHHYRRLGIKPEYEAYHGINRPMTQHDLAKQGRIAAGVHISRI